MADELMDVVVWVNESVMRSRVVCEALVEGIKKCGDTAVARGQHTYTKPVGDAAVFYSLHNNLYQIMNDYSADNLRRSIHIDLGFWHRKPSHNRYVGYHRFAIDGVHSRPLLGMPSDRRKNFGVKVLEERQYKPKDHILLCGQSEKAAVVYGLKPEGWERSAVRAIHAGLPNKRIVYYPKLSWRGARPITGTTFWRGGDHHEILRHENVARASGAVAHHSNFLVTLLTMGIPVAAADGALKGLVTSFPEGVLDEQNDLPYERREDIVNGVAYLQWNVEEMRSGVMWRHLKERRL